jgi:hypothetical protein
MVEEGFDGGLFTLVVVRVIWDETHETTWKASAMLGPGLMGLSHTSDVSDT